MPPQSSARTPRHATQWTSLIYTLRLLPRHYTIYLTFSAYSLNAQPVTPRAALYPSIVYGLINIKFLFEYFKKYRINCLLNYTVFCTFCVSTQVSTWLSSSILATDNSRSFFFISWSYSTDDKASSQSFAPWQSKLVTTSINLSCCKMKQLYTECHIKL